MWSFKIAFKNLIGAGRRTWLNVAVLSIAFVVIVFFNGLLDGWNIQARTDTTAWETGYGRMTHPLYDPYDPYTLADAHGLSGSLFASEIQTGNAVPVLITQASAYPNGRLINVMLRGIDPRQNVLLLPSRLLDSLPPQAGEETIPAIIGHRMAGACQLNEGDKMIVRWRDVNGTFDAREVFIAGIFQTTVPTVDAGQVWIPLEALRNMTGLYGESTMIILGPWVTESHNMPRPGTLLEGWRYEDREMLLQEIEDVIKAKRSSSVVISVLLLGIALLAVFDTQVLSVFRRQKEIGTYIALGMTRLKVMFIFTIEGTMHSLLAIALGCVWGIPLLKWLQHTGIPMPQMTDQAGLAVSDKIIPMYSMGLILTSVLLVVISSLVVSYLPARKIAKMRPTEALKGKLI